MKLLQLLIVLMCFSCVTVGESPFLAKADRSVYRIGAVNNWGTGFAIRGDSAKTYIITNSHICDSLEEEDKLIQGKRAWSIKTVKHYSKHDLCAIAAPEDAKAINLALSPPEYGDRVTVKGYPAIKDMTTFSGRALSVVENDYLNYPLPPEDCVGDKFEIRGKEIPPGLIIPQCTLVGPMQKTSVQSDGGASGSPVLNDDGEVVGVVLATVGNIPLAVMIPHAPLRDFLKQL